MKICLLSNYSPPLDEGMKNVAYYLGAELEKQHQVLNLSLQGLFSGAFWQQIKDFKPHIVHYVPGPSFASLIIARAIKVYCKRAKTVMSVTQPRVPGWLKIFLPLLKPDLTLTQSAEMEEMLVNQGYRTEFLPNGVDVERFSPASAAIKRKLRDKYGLPRGKFIILHIGSIRKRRNLQLLAEIQQKNRDSQVLIVGSTSTPLEQDIYEGLVESGCIVWRKYFEKIEEVYALSDGYIFPAVTRLSSIDLPLSVMEAMSCNLPVISTRFGALSRLFAEGDGFYFAETKGEFLQRLDNIRAGTEVSTRERVLPYSWGNIAARLEKIYEEVTSGKPRMKKGRILICFIGIDGSGKTTQARALAKVLAEKGIRGKYVYNRFRHLLTLPFIIIGKLLFFRGKGKAENYPGYSVTMKSVFKNRFLSIIYQYFLILDYSLQSLIRLNLSLVLGRSIVCDRYVHDTVMDIAADLNHSKARLRATLGGFIRFFPKPDLIFLIDVSEEVAYQRKDDTPSIGFLKDRRRLYLDMGREYKMTILDGSQDKAELESIIQAKLDEVINWPSH